MSEKRKFISFVKSFKGNKKLIGDRVRSLGPIPYSVENKTILRNLCVYTRNFSNTSLRKSLSRFCEKDSDVRLAFSIFFLKLKLIQLCFPYLKAYCYHVLRNSFDLEYQEKYIETLDFVSESKRFKNRQFLFNKVTDMRHLELLQILYNTDPEFYIPSTIFFRYEYEKESKLEYSFMEFSDHKLPLFRQKVKRYLRSLKKRDIFVPPPGSLPKAASSRYNDGGLVKYDYELPERSVSCGFKLQKFNPRPLQTREVWLPDKSTKISNSFWMMVGRQFLKRDSRYPSDDPEETWNLIKDKLVDIGYFDVSAFGLQYPQQYLLVVAEEIANLYGNPDLDEQVTILARILSKVKLEVEDGKFVYPTRGIGLGYYEDLKTIGVIAIIDQFKPISVYGDQGLLSSSVLEQAVETLRAYGFIIKPNKVEHKQSKVKWAGYEMTRTSLVRPKLYLESLIPIVEQEFHWERKNLLASYVEKFPQFSEKISRIFPKFYYILYGYELFPSDCMSSLDNGGVCPCFPYEDGYSKTYKVQRLKTPRVTINDNLVYETPFFTEWKSADAKRHQIKRKDVYKESPMMDCSIFDYSNPRLVSNKTKKPKFTITQSSVTEFYDLRLIAKYGITIGRVTYNLSGDELYQAFLSCAYASNPFEVYATGGYRVLTEFRAPPVVSSEMIDLITYLYDRVDLIKPFLTEKFDKDTFFIEDFKRDPPKRKRPSTSANYVEAAQYETEPPRKVALVSFDDIKRVEFGDAPLQRSDRIFKASSLIEDLQERFFQPFVFPDDVSEHMSGDEELFLEDSDLE